ncbi:protein-tyrosine phosphatase-like protein [Lasiosphaeria miniovina]|uniref:protein-tyrosine-phosphatase n=1 Tax=Lasiosphaeria miniovina TaxID=1954250 RepID=A0AA40BHN9_9PEZI|nr:protein-tyrosine phosphatase-like protein [Lasiosphaeria miniovina]KAK0734369.1 protein-tyrosine phosphatase-like protein [Lasiosphaeria miniovina]
MAPSSRHAGNLGQIIEYIPDRLYLASYVDAPDENTLFPYPDPPPRSPSKRSQQRAVDGPSPAQQSTAAHKRPFYFTVDDTLLYNAFHHDFGPLHIGHLYRFALQFHEILGARENKERPVVFWSRADPRSRANASCLLACYMVLIQSWPPHLALAPVAQVDPPLMPFRDAGYSQADYGIMVQDVVYGVWKAKEEGCCVLETFDLEEYERFERVEHGDFNWITPNFLAFASPQHTPVARTPEGSEGWAALPKTLAAVDVHPTLPQPFKNVLRHFSERNIGLVVRLNSVLYNPSFFEALGIQHLDMIFDDGTCPPLSTVRKFIRLAHETITVKKKGIAVHCKAGLGRTGCLIGAYLIYRHGFTANEIIAFMRFMRPGMVVGPQQHWLHLNQGVFREWWVEERLERRLRKEAMAAAAAAANLVPSTPIRAMQKASLGQRSGSKNNNSTSTPPNRGSTRTPLGEIDQDHARDNTIGVHEDYLPAPTPGQPRKTQRDRHHPYSRAASASLHTAATLDEEDEAAVDIDASADPSSAETTQTEVLAMLRTSGGSSAESEEELHLRSMRRSSNKPSASPEQRHRRSERSVSHHQTSSSVTGTMTTTTTTMIYQVVDSNDASHDIENIGTSSASAAARHTKAAAYDGIHQRAASASSSGVLAKVRGNAKRPGAVGAVSAGVVSGTVREAGVRKTSGRVGSVSAAPTAAATAVARKISGL